MADISNHRNIVVAHRATSGPAMISGDTNTAEAARGVPIAAVLSATVQPVPVDDLAPIRELLDGLYASDRQWVVAGLVRQVEIDRRYLDAKAADAAESGEDLHLR